MEAHVGLGTYLRSAFALRVAAPRGGSAVTSRPIEPIAPQRPQRTPSAVRSRPPSPAPAAPRRRGAPALLGLLLGALLLGGGAYGAMVTEIWTPAPFPFEEMIPLDPMLARSVILGVAGALLGLLLGALLGGGRRR